MRSKMRELCLLWAFLITWNSVGLKGYIRVLPKRVCTGFFCGDVGAALFTLRYDGETWFG